MPFSRLQVEHVICSSVTCRWNMSYAVQSPAGGTCHMQFSRLQVEHVICSSVACRWNMSYAVQSPAGGTCHMQFSRLQVEHVICSFCYALSSTLSKPEARQVILTLNSPCMHLTAGINRSRAEATRDGLNSNHAETSFQMFALIL